MNFGNSAVKLCKRTNQVAFAQDPSKCQTKKLKRLVLIEQEKDRSSCSGTKLYSYSKTNYPNLKVNIEVKCA